VTARIVVLASGSGSTLQALLDAAAASEFGAQITAVGTDRPGVGALKRAARAGVGTFTVPFADFADRGDWDAALTSAVAGHRPHLVVSAGFMRLVGPAFLARFAGRYVNSHPALLPSFPGMHGPRDALAYGVKVTGCTLFVVDAGVDTGPIIAQTAVPVLDGDDEARLHERIKAAERSMLVEYIGRMARHGWTVDNRRVSVP
jgi:phosphoribosylglycinamide formyltransferase-1